MPRNILAFAKFLKADEDIKHKIPIFSREISKKNTQVYAKLENYTYIELINQRFLFLIMKRVPCMYEILYMAKIHQN